MDSSKFDSLVLSLVNGTSRRRIIRAVGGGALASGVGLRALATAEASDRAKNRRRRCIRNTPPFSVPALACDLSKQCCGSGSCCDFGTGNGPGCFNLLSNQSACGAGCDTAVNCLNFNPPRRCVNGKCVEDETLGRGLWRPDLTGGNATAKPAGDRLSRPRTRRIQRLAKPRVIVDRGRGS